MAIDPCVEASANDQTGTYVLKFAAKRVEADFESVFFARGGSLGSCAARSDLDFALTHSEAAEHSLLTEKLQQEVVLPISQALVEASHSLSARAHYANGLAANGHKLGPVLFLSDRARLNLSSSRVGASINGSAVSTLSSQASVALKDIFAETTPIEQFLEMPQKDLLEVPKDTVKVSTDASVTGSGVEEMANITESLIKKRQVLVPLNFESIPLSYSNWDAVQAVVTVHEPKIYRVCDDGSHSGPIAVVFVKEKELDLSLAKSEIMLQGIYNASWAMCQNLVFPPSPNLTKSVMNTPAGYNASSYAPAAAINDTPAAYSDETLDSLIGACLRVEMDAEEISRLCAALATPNPEAALQYSGSMASAMSAFSAFTMPYRIDGGPIILPTGLQMIESESWRAEPVRSVLQADDCDGSACSAISVVSRAAVVAADPILSAKVPHLRALGNSLGAHYVFGTCVLAANAGHADAANEAAQKVAGHAIALAVPKMHFLSALDRGAYGSIKGAPVVSVENREKVKAARFGALFPKTLTDRMQLSQADAAAFYDHDQLAASEYANAVSGLQPLSMEGTTLASSRLYTHDLAERTARTDSYLKDKKIATKLAPNISRTHKTLDSGEAGTHAFYNSFVELSVSMQHPLFTDAALREMDCASPHYRFARPCEADQVLKVAGTTPKNLATGNFAIVPLWQSGVSESPILDAAHAEAVANKLPKRGKALQLRDDQLQSLSASLAVLAALDDEFYKKREAEPMGESHDSRHVFSMASLVGNPEAIRAFAKTIVAQPNFRGTVHGLDDIVEGVAISGDGSDVARLVVVELTLNLED